MSAAVQTSGSQQGQALVGGEVINESGVYIANGKCHISFNGAQQEPWKVQASSQALNTSNPIREVIETMNLAENPNKKVIPLSIGDPTIFGNLKPCNEILDALHNANSCGKYYGYQTAAGMESARDSVVEYHRKSTGNIVERQDIILASGCSHAIDLCICVLAKAGQNILIPRPGFPLYKTLTSVYGVHYKQYNLLADKNWNIDLEHLESLIDENTAAIVINNPSNPCGSVFSKKHLLQILELAQKYRKPIIADEIYDKFVFAPQSYRRHNKYFKNSTTNGCNEQNLASNNLENVQPNSNEINLLAKQHNSSKVNNLQEDGTKFTAMKQDLRSSKQFNDHKLDTSFNKLSYCQSNDCYSIGIDCDSSYNFCDAQEKIKGDEQSYIPFISLSSLSMTVPILTCGGISKTCLIPGLRLGWVIINDKANVFDVSVRNGLSRLTQRLMGPNSLVQGALSDILTKVPEDFYSETMDFIFQNAKLCYKRLSQVHGLQPYMPRGSMYLMVKFDSKLYPTIQGDLDFTSKLMNEESVLVLPGKCFDFPNYFRICLTVPTDVMNEALDRMTEFCRHHHVDYISNKNTNQTESMAKMDVSVERDQNGDN